MAAGITRATEWLGERVRAGVAATIVALVAAPSMTAAESADDAVPLPPDPQPTRAAPLPDLRAAPAGPVRKERFFDYLAPIVRSVNDEIRTQRTALKRLRQRLEQGAEPRPEVARWLDGLAKRYRVEATSPAERVQALLHRVDIIPVSLALAQGAMESAWGTSRFARVGNNIFGKWCFQPGCGVVPGRRPPGATYEVEAYSNVAASVRAYMHHLNSHPVYAVLRERRAQARAEGRRPQGVALAAGLERYSAKGQQYVQSIRGVIRHNDLDEWARAG